MLKVLKMLAAAVIVNQTLERAPMKPLGRERSGRSATGKECEINGPGGARERSITRVRLQTRH